MKVGLRNYLLRRKKENQDSKERMSRTIPSKKEQIAF